MGERMRRPTERDYLWTWKKNSKKNLSTKQFLPKSAIMLNFTANFPFDIYPIEVEISSSTSSLLQIVWATAKREDDFVVVGFMPPFIAISFISSFLLLTLRCALVCAKKISDSHPNGNYCWVQWGDGVRWKVNGTCARVSLKSEELEEIENCSAEVRSKIRNCSGFDFTRVYMFRRDTWWRLKRVLSKNLISRLDLRQPNRILILLTIFHHLIFHTKSRHHLRMFLERFMIFCLCLESLTAPKFPLMSGDVMMKVRECSKLFALSQLKHHWSITYNLQSKSGRCLACLDEVNQVNEPGRDN